MAHRAAKAVAERPTELRCQQGMRLVGNIGSIGPLTVEIAQFLRDEVRLRYGGGESSRDTLEKGLVPLVNWMLRNGPPAHDTFEDQRRVPFSSILRAATRATDVVWTVCQLLGDQVLRPVAEWDVEPLRAIKAIEMDVEWPQVTSFSTLFSTLSDRTHIAETKRLTSFNYLNLSNQAVTEQDFGAVLYGEEDGRVIPVRWLSASLSGCNLQYAHFFMAHLREADLSYANLTFAELGGSTLSHADLTGAVLRNANLSRADLFATDFTRADLQGTLLYGALISRTRFHNAVLTKASFRPKARSGHERYRHRPMTVIAGAEFVGTKLQGVDFGTVKFEDCDFQGADLTGANVSGVIVGSGNTFTGAILEGLTIAHGQAEKIGLTREQVASGKVVSDEEGKRPGDDVERQ